MIDAISIKGFKSIRDQQVTLTPINVLIGENGIGKTNFISAFELMRDIYEKKLESYVLRKGGANVMLYNGVKITSRIKISLTLNQARNKYTVLLDEAQDSLFIRLAETSYSFNGKWYTQKCDENVKEATIKDDRTGQAYYVSNFLQQFQIYHFHDTGDKSLMKSFCDIHQNRFLHRDGANIAAYLFYLKERYPKHFLRIERVISSVSPYFERFELVPNNLNPSTIRLEWRQKGVDDMIFNAYQLSDGTLRFICLTTLLMQPEPPTTILIDEPELGLHPKAISKFCDMVKVASQHSQIIVSTQSVNVVDNFSPNDIIVTGRENNATTFRRLEETKLEQWLQDYSMGELWEMNVIAK